MLRDYFAFLQYGLPGSTACVEFDGGNPTPIEQVEHIAGPVLGFYGGGG